MGLNLPLGAITHLVGDALTRVKTVHAKLRQACACKELEYVKDIVASTGEVDVDAFSAR